jgi:hypothetical protein
MYETNQYPSLEAIMRMHLDFRTAFFWVIMQRVVVITQKSAVLVYFAAEA